MAFILELHTLSSQNYIKNFVVNIIREFDIKTDVFHQGEKLRFSFDAKHPKLQECLDKIASTLPASLFLKASSSFEDDVEPLNLPSVDNSYPISIGLCPSCQKEMLDVSSSRYYYPFTSCNCCGANHSFLSSYPYNRANTSFKFLVPCEKCKKEQEEVGKNELHHINSCHNCGVAVRLVDKKSERYANDAGSFRTMFEVCAKAIIDDKKVLIKTTMGYRVFYKATNVNHNSLLMMINSSKITDNLALITEEFQALLSIERPIMQVTLKNEELKKVFDANTAFVKYPDDGFSILLGTELQRLGFEYVAYEAVDDSYEADIVMDYDLEVTPQDDMRFFLNKDTQFIASGDRVSFPSKSFSTKEILSVAGNYIGVPQDGKVFFDKMDYFDGVDVVGANVLEGDKNRYHQNQKYFLKDEATFFSVVAEHNLFGEKVIGAYFDEVASFLYYDGKNVLRVVPPRDFEAENLLENLINLRDGSDRLISNIKEKLPDIYERLQNLQDKKGIKLFDAVGVVLGLDDSSMRGVVKEAMKFVGKGGIQIDTHIKDNRFDNIAFLSSIISYKLAGVSNSILAYSIFESLGDYFYDIVQELQSKTKATKVVICGSDFANQSLFSRIQRNFKISPPYMSKKYPIGKESAVVGGVYI